MYDIVLINLLHDDHHASYKKRFLHAHWYRLQVITITHSSVQITRFSVMLRLYFYRRPCDARLKRYIEMNSCVTYLYEKNINIRKNSL